jgi:murein DD-endopeptidase MepM/ murein hydrolase activator NlpD
MGPHLHFEVRDASSGAPFPGPYRRFNVDPRPWLEARGVRFDARGTVLG